MRPAIHSPWEPPPRPPIEAGCGCLVLLVGAILLAGLALITVLVTRQIG